MGRYLILAHQTASSPELSSMRSAEISSEKGDSEFVLLIPATPPEDLLDWQEGNAEEIARRAQTWQLRAWRRPARASYGPMLRIHRRSRPFRRRSKGRIPMD